MRIVTISDTHCKLDQIKLPEGDLLLHSGDLTFSGNLKEIATELNILGQYAKKFKYGAVFCAGNHDWMAEKDPAMLSLLAKDNGLIWLQDQEIVIEGFKIYGSGWTPEFGGWALNLSRYEGELTRKWAMIPDDTQILVTHGPPKGILDLTAGYEMMTPYGNEFEPPERVGCWDLRERVKKLKQLRLHCFGHIHHSYGQEIVDGVQFVNASICNEQYKPLNPPIVIDL